MKSLTPGHYFLNSIRYSRQITNRRNLAKVEFMRDFMPVLDICKFDEDSMKQANVRIIFPHYMSMGDLRTNYSHVNSPISPKANSAKVVLFFCCCCVFFVFFFVFFCCCFFFFCLFFCCCFFFFFLLTALPASLMKMRSKIKLLCPDIFSKVYGALKDG